MNKDLSLYKPDNIQQAMEFAEVICKSGLVPDSFQGKPHNVVVAVQWGAEIGLKPMQSLQNISVIQGRAALWGDSVLALIKQQPTFNGCTETTTGKLSDKSMVARCEMARVMPSGKEEVTIREFSMEDAQQAGLLNKKGPWQQYTKRMLQLRARTFCARDAFPDALKGLTTVEEMQDYPEPQKVKITEPVIKPDEVKKVLEAPSDGNLKPPTTKLDLKIPGKEGATTYEQHEFANEYAGLMLDMFKCKLDPAEKRTRLKELEKVNIQSLHKLEDKDVMNELLKKRLSYNKSLSIEAKELEANNEPD